MKSTKTNRRGATLLEVMVPVGIVGILAAVVGLGACSALTSTVAGDQIKADAEKSLRSTAADLGLKVDGVSCGSRTNEKGMVHCTLNSGGKMIPFTCIGKFKAGDGCKMQTITGADATSQ